MRVAPFRCPYCGLVFPRLREFIYCYRRDTLVREGLIDRAAGHARRSAHIQSCCDSQKLADFGSMEPVYIYTDGLR